MARQSGNSLFGSLRGKIWVSTSVLAVFICTFGLISYLVVSLLMNDAFYGVFIPFLFLAFTVLVFGWWLSNEVVNPIEKVTLLAKSLERSSSTSIPRTSGSTETDQLLQAIQRNNQQMQKIVTLMDKVANGNLDVTPIQGSDRLSTSFQKLLAKVTESINAKEELDALRNAVNDLKMDISGVRSGDLDVEIRNESALTKEISGTIKYLVDNLSRLITAVQTSSSEAESSVSKVGDEIESLIQRDEVRAQEMAGASVALKQVPNLINKITDDLMGSAKSARTTIEKARHGTKVAAQNSSSVSNLRKQVREDVKRIQNLTERSHDIERVAKIVEDLANRTNMIALNASIQATELGGDGHGFVLIAEEVERLAARANGTNKQISTLNKAILAEIGKVENSVETTMAEVASLSKFAIESGNVLNEMERYVAQFLNLQESLIAYSKGQSEETDAAFATFADSITETETTVETLRRSNTDLAELAQVMRGLKSEISDFRLPDESWIGAMANPEEDFAPDEYSGEGSEEERYEEFANEEFDTEAFNAAKMDTAEFQAMSGIPDEESADDQMASDETLDEKDTFEMDDTPNLQDGSDEGDALEMDDSVDLDEAANSDDPSDEMSLELESDEFDSGELLDLDPDPATQDAAFELQPQPEESADTHSVENEDNGVLDLYNASLSAPAETEEFDSGEYAADELIQEIDGDETEQLPPYSAPEATALDADELEDLLDPDNFDNPSEHEKILSV
ncbi:MAG: methyl-accepting chemotaxis protein [Acidobacteriota bacterium]|nr:methyl-accepting chemotaxis protein [Acidobacteriota bacterium]MDH3530290.1 methyl-accepting chemotaxis protein [Acidobacteriota bacterium]